MGVEEEAKGSSQNQIQFRYVRIIRINRTAPLIKAGPLYAFLPRNLAAKEITKPKRADNKTKSGKNTSRPGVQGPLREYRLKKGMKGRAKI